jgi:hypothetical protein
MNLDYQMQIKDRIHNLLINRTNLNRFEVETLVEVMPERLHLLLWEALDSLYQDGYDTGYSHGLVDTQYED